MRVRATRASIQRKSVIIAIVVGVWWVFVVRVGCVLYKSLCGFFSGPVVRPLSRMRTLFPTLDHPCVRGSARIACACAPAYATAASTTRTRERDMYSSRENRTYHTNHHITFAHARPINQCAQHARSHVKMTPFMRVVIHKHTHTNPKHANTKKNTPTARKHENNRN